MQPPPGVLDRSNVGRLTSAVALVTALVAATTSAADAGNWATPAAGPSTSGGPEVLFTFDDGPNPATTPKILDALAAHHVQAVFFMVGWRFQRGNVDKTRDLMHRILDAGHVVANHTVSHAHLCTGKPEPAAAEIDDARAILEREAGMPVTWFRAPYGAWCPRLAGMVEERHLTHVYWDIDPQEWRTGNAKLTEQLVERHLRRLTGRAVLLMHDTKVATTKALPKILDWIETENARRAKAGAPTIRIVGAPEWAAEMLGADTIAEARSLGTDILGGLAQGLASALP